MINRRTHERKERCLHAGLCEKRLLKTMSELQLGESRVGSGGVKTFASVRQQEWNKSSDSHDTCSERQISRHLILPRWFLKRRGAPEPYSLWPPLSSSSPCRSPRLSTNEAASQSFALLYQGNLGLSLPDRHHISQTPLWVSWAGAQQTSGQSSDAKMIV